MYLNVRVHSRGTNAGEVGGGTSLLPFEERVEDKSAFLSRELENFLIFLFCVDIQ